MKKKWFFTGAAVVLGLVLILWVQVVGEGTDRFGFGPLLSGELTERSTPYQYPYEEDMTERTLRKIQVDWVYGEVEIRPVSGNVLRITECSDRALEEDDALEYDLSGGTLEVNWNNTFSFLGRFSDCRKNLTIEIPRQYAAELNSLKCKTHSGDIRVNDLTADTMVFSSTNGDLRLTGLQGETAKFSTHSGAIAPLDVHFTESITLSTSSGELTSSNITTKALEMKTVSGQLVYSGEAETVKARSISGPVVLLLADSPEAAALESVSGTLRLGVPGDCGFTAEYASVSGSFDPGEFAGSYTAGHSGQITVGSGKSQFEFTTTSGEMSVTKS